MDAMHAQRDAVRRTAASTSRRLWGIVAAVLLIAWAPVVLAADDEMSDEEAATEDTTRSEEEAARVPGKGVENIVVTARKREERLQEVPIAVTSLTGSQLDDQKIDDALQIQFEVPNLFFSKTNFSSSNLQIRGIGSAVVAASGEPAVGIHVNTVPQTDSRIFEQEFFDVERVEVLRGPQGTLFGRNSTGGSFNVYTRKPSNQWESDAELEIGNYSSVRFKGATNIPFNDTVQMRIAGMVHDRDGWIKNLYTNSQIDDRTLGAIRGSFRINVTDYTTVDAMVSYFKEKDSRSRIGKQLCSKDTRPFPFSIGCTDGPLGFGTLASYSTLGGILDSTALGLYPIGVDANANAVNPPDLFTHNSRIDPTYDADEILAILDISHEFESLTATWVTGYQNTSVNSQQDYNMVQPSLAWTPAVVGPTAAVAGLQAIDPNNTGTATHICIPGFGCVDRSFAQDESIADSEQISTEVRAISDYDGRFNYTVGAIYTYFVTRTDYKVFFSSAEILGRIFNNTRPPGQAPHNPEQYHYNNETSPARTQSFGLFGEIYYDITDATKLTLGARYTYDDKTVRTRQYLLNGAPPVTPGVPGAGDGQLPLFQNQSASWNNGTGVVSVKHDFDFDFTDQSMVYGSVSRGFKPGGFNPPAVASLGVAETFDPEIVWAYEVGTKNQFWENRVQSNLTAFFYDYEGYQISKIVSRTAVNENIDAFLWGLEAEFIVVPIDDLRISFSLAYLGSEIQSGTSIDPADPTAGDPNWDSLKDTTSGAALASNIICQRAIPGVPLTCPNPISPYAGSVISNGIAKNLAGRELPNTPDVQINIGAQYTFAAPWNGFLTPRINYFWQNEMYGRFFNEVRDEIGSWSQANAGLRWNNEDNSVYVDLWVRNFTDNKDITAQYLTDASSGNFTNVFVLQPRTYGITAGVAF